MSKVKRKESNSPVMNGGQSDFSAFENGLDELTGAEIFQIFTNEENFLELCNISSNFPDTMSRFCWRLKYILGETFLDIQRRLSLNSLLQNSILLDSSEVHELSNSIIQRGKMANQSKEFQNFKKVLEAAFNSGSCDQNALITIYGYCMKIWKPSISFEMQLSESENLNNKVKSKPEQSKKLAMFELNQHSIDENLNPNPRIGPYKALRMPPGSNKSYQQKSKKVKNTQKAQQYPRQDLHGPNPKPIRKIEENFSYNRPQLRKAVPASPDDQTINLNDGKDDMRPAKCMNRNWSLAQQQFFCRMFIQNNTPEAVKAQLQKKYGVDARWSVPKQIEFKINSLTAKVYRKFMSLETTNANIIKFRSLKPFVLSSDKIKERERGALNKLFAALYQAMLNVDEKKKTIISNKILEVISVCQKIEK